MNRFMTVGRATVVAALVLSPVALVAGPVGAGHAAAGATYYLAPSGSDTAAGTHAAPWASIAHAQSVARPGDTVYLLGGRYAYTRASSSCASRTARVDVITLNRSGSSGSPIRYWAYPGEKPVLDFTQVTDDCRIRGLDVTGDWIHLKGLEITGARQNNKLNHESWGIFVTGSNNVFEQLDTHHHMGPGLFISGGGGNLVLNSDSHDNYDANSSNGAGESGDGFGSHYTPAGSPANVFRGCRAWWNSDDGFDLISTYSPVLIENSWAWRNGYIPGTTISSGNGNGFKVGGFGGEYDAGTVKHTVRFSVAFLNKAAGFYSNHHPVANDYFNNTSYGNRPDFNLLGVDRTGAAVGRGNLRNNIAYTGTLTSNLSGTSSASNSWDLGVPLSDAQFQSVSTTGWDAPRRADGSLPVQPSLRLAPGSALIDRGVDVGLPYTGRAPDLGAFEFGSELTTTTTTTTTTTPTATTTGTTTGTTTSTTGTTTSTTTSAGGACSAGYQTIGSWPGGFQGEVTVTAGAATISGWTVRWGMDGGQSVTQVWNGTLNAGGPAVSVSNASYNGSLQPSGSTTFGFIATGTPTGGPLTCTMP